MILLIKILTFPIAAPAWIIESLYRKTFNSKWEFAIWSSSIYIIVLIIFASILFFSESLLNKIIAVYVFTSLEIVGIAVCSGLIVGNRLKYLDILKDIARRKRKSYSSFNITTIRSLWIAISSYFYSVVYFGIVSLFIYQIYPNSYTGVANNDQLETLFDFTYYSFMSLVTFGYSEIFPAEVFSKSLYMFETFLGLMYLLLIFTAIATAIIEGRLSDRNK